MESVIISIGIVYFVGHVLTHFFSMSKVPDVLILILFGVLIGPVLGVVTTEEIGVAGKLFTNMALIMILFEGGLNLQIQNLMDSAKQAVALTSVFFGISVVVISVILYVFCDFGMLPAIATGCICAGTSSAVVIPMIAAINTGKEASTILIIESALTDVLCIVFTIGVLRSVETGEIALGKIIGNLISSLVLASVIGAAGGFFWLRMINKIRSFESTQFATFASMFIIYGVAEMLDYSGAIAALAFGIVLGNNGEVGTQMVKLTGTHAKLGAVNDAERMLYREIVFLVKIFFFIFLGISISFDNPEMFLISFAIVIALYTLRPFVTRFFVKHGVENKDKSIISVMIPKGLAAAVLATLPVQYNIAEQVQIQSVTYGVILISIVLTSILIPLMQRTSLGNLYNKMFE